MKFGKKKIGLMLICVLFCSLGQTSLLYSSSQKIKIKTSVFPLKEFAKSVAGEKGEVSLLLPPGAEIHTWKPKPSDIIELSTSDVFIYIGAGLEPWLEDILKSVQNPNLMILEAGHGIIQRGEEEHQHDPQESDSEHQHNHVDPHIWLNFEYDCVIVDKIKSLLSKIDPENSSTFEKNASKYKNILKNLDLRYQKDLSSCRSRYIFLGGHAAFGYLAQKYGLKQIALYGVSPDARPSPKKLAEVLEMAKKYKTETIFFEVYVSKELADVLAREIGARTLVLNPGANITKEQMRSGITFIKIMEDNLENLKNGLSCR
jgi:zinc transport system substrate-binding protein